MKKHSQAFEQGSRQVLKLIAEKLDELQLDTHAQQLLTEQDKQILATKLRFLAQTLAPITTQPT